jgi:predicted aspartyl protease
MISFDYDTSYYPAMPVAEATIVYPDDPQANIRCVALIDTGADGTMLPADLLQSIDAPLIGDATMRWVIGEGEIVDVYLVQIRVGPYGVGAVRAVALPVGSEAILGRDVLNHLILTLNGLANVVEVSDEPN